jgi:hypothetical protein
VGFPLFRELVVEDRATCGAVDLDATDLCLQHRREQHGIQVAVASDRTPKRVLRSYDTGGRNHMNIFYIIGVVVVVLFVLGYFGLR